MLCFVGSIIADYIAYQLKKNAQNRSDGLQQNPVGLHQTPSPIGRKHNEFLLSSFAPPVYVNQAEDNVDGKQRNTVGFTYKLSKYPEFPKKRFKFLEKLGNGIYGEVSCIGFVFHDEYIYVSIV